MEAGPGDPVGPARPAGPGVRLAYRTGLGCRARAHNRRRSRRSPQTAMAPFFARYPRHDRSPSRHPSTGPWPARHPLPNRRQPRRSRHATHTGAGRCSRVACRSRSLPSTRRRRRPYAGPSDHAPGFSHGHRATPASTRASATAVVRCSLSFVLWASLPRGSAWPFGAPNSGTLVSGTFGHGVGPLSRSTPTSTPSAVYGQGRP